MAIAVCGGGLAPPFCSPAGMAESASSCAFAFDEAQGNTCRTIHKDKFDRAASYAKAHDEALSAIPAGERAKHEAFEPIRGIFAELQGQLEAIPTPKQRREAQP